MLLFYERKNLEVLIKGRRPRFVYYSITTFISIRNQYISIIILRASFLCHSIECYVIKLMLWHVFLLAFLYSTIFYYNLKQKGKLLLNN